MCRDVSDVDLIGGLCRVHDFSSLEPRRVV